MDYIAKDDIDLPMKGVESVVERNVSNCSHTLGMLTMLIHHKQWMKRHLHCMICLCLFGVSTSQKFDTHLGQWILCTCALEERSMIEGLRPPMLVQSIVENITQDRQNMGRANQVVVHAPHAKVKT